MNQIKECNICDQRIEIKLAKGIQVNDYQMQLIHKEKMMLNMQKDKRSKTRLLFDIRGYCSLACYLQETNLDELALIRLLIDLLEGIQHIQKEFYVYVTLDTVFFTEEGVLKFLVLPLVKNAYEPIDMEMKTVLIDIVKTVQVKEGNEILGLLVRYLKLETFHMTSLLQELHNHNPSIPKVSIWRKLFNKEEDNHQLSYPLPCVVQKSNIVQRESYIEEFEESPQQTMMLFEEMKSRGVLSTNQDQYEIHKESFTIGRNERNDCYLAIPSISKEHAVILREQDGYYLKDLHSSNATYVNGKKLEPMQRCLLHDQDQVTFADTTFDFHEY